MNNLHRELDPISESAWASIEEEARRTFKINLAGRRVVDVEGPGGLTLAAVGTGHLGDTEAAGEGVTARVRRSMPLVAASLAARSSTACWYSAACLRDSAQ